MHLSRGPSPISLSTQEAWPVAAAVTEYINAYFKGGQHNRWVSTSALPLRSHVPEIESSPQGCDASAPLVLSAGVW